MEKQDKLVKFLGGGVVLFLDLSTLTLKGRDSITNFKQIPLIFPRIYTIILKDLRSDA